mgnify:CR=1 FL=1
MLFKSLFTSANERYLKKFKKTVKKINDLEASFQQLSDAQLTAKTTEYKERIKNGETLDSLLPEAFATVREAAKRVLGLRPFDVQLLGGMVLFDNKIAEMKTGEGKTLVATLPVYLNALTGKGVHVVTVNEYLAKRDSEWMGKIYRFLGLTVGCLTSQMSPSEKRKAYQCDITYATNNELGFDYLRDNMALSKESMVQRPFYYAIVDEVDSILIDEARTPLIISGRAEDSSETYKKMDALMCSIRPEHYEKDEKHKNVTLTELGSEFMENLMQESGMIVGGLYDANNIEYVHYMEQALRAHTLFTKDVDYIVKDGKVMIIDEFTGRIMNGRRYSDGLHQAIEAKEGVAIQAENQTLASITFQNYFRLYPKLAGMTGTAMTESAEFDDIYKLEVIEIPTNKPLARKDEQDVIYRTAQEKYEAIIEEIKSAHKRNQPILVGTTSIEKSEILADLLKKNTNLKFNVLNARHHESEAQIIAQAGVPGAITIATNMAGRGTDIQLGGNLEMRLANELEKNPSVDKEALKKEIKADIIKNKKIALEAGGLYVLGSERHESRRIDNQLRGRSGRQGDPGVSKFYVSLEDDLMRIFGSERIGNILKTMGLKQGESIVHPWISKAIAKAQQKVESYHFDVRKNLLKYDDVMNDQRKIIYEQRRELLESDKVRDILLDMQRDCFENLVYSYAPDKSAPEDWDTRALHDELYTLTGMDAPFDSWKAESGITPQDLLDRIVKIGKETWEKKMSVLPPDAQTEIERSLLLQTVDQAWKEHLKSLDFMKTSIGLRAYAQKNPLFEYKHEAFVLFQNMLDKLRERVAKILGFAELKIQAKTQVPPETPNMQEGKEGHQPPKKQDFAGQDIPRNAPCPCGSGKKYKHCCGKLA